MLIIPYTLQCNQASRCDILILRKVSCSAMARKKKKRWWRARLLSTVAGAGFPPQCDVAYHANAIGKKQTDLLCVMAGCDISMDRSIHQWDRVACKWAHSKCQLGRLFEESLALNCCLIICSNNNSVNNNNNNSSTKTTTTTVDCLF